MSRVPWFLGYRRPAKARGPMLLFPQSPSNKTRLPILTLPTFWTTRSGEYVFHDDVRWVLPRARELGIDGRARA